MLFSSDHPRAIRVVRKKRLAWLSRGRSLGIKRIITGKISKIFAILRERQRTPEGRIEVVCGIGNDVFLLALGHVRARIEDCGQTISATAGNLFFFNFVEYSHIFKLIILNGYNN